MKKNIIANFFGRIWGILSGFLFIPLYIKYLGFESYSVISFTILLAGILVILDGGLTATLSREFARKDNDQNGKIKVYETLETCYLFVVSFCIILVVIFSDVIANNLNIKSFTLDQISFFLKIVSLDIGFQLVFRFYMGGLLGLNDQVLANLCQIGWGIMRNALVILIIFFSPSLKAFFIWQSLSTIIFTFIVKYLLDRKIYSTNKFKMAFSFDYEVFKGFRKFTGGMLLISLISALSSQMDKIFISKMLSIETLGYYTLAVSISSGLLVVVSPIATAILPLFTSLYSLALFKEAKDLFNRYSVIVSILVFGFLGNIVFFDKSLIWIWTGNHSVAEQTYKLVPFVASSYAFIALQSISYHVAIANGYTKLNNIMGIVTIFIIFPGYYFGINQFGGIGAAYVFSVIQFFTLIIYIFFINKKFIKEELLYNVYCRQILLPMFVSFFVAFLFSKIKIFEGQRFLSLLWIGISTFSTLVITGLLLTSKNERQKIFATLKF